MRMAILHEGPGPASKPKSEYKEVRIPLQIKLMKSDVPSKNEKHRHFLTFIEQNRDLTQTICFANKKLANIVSI